MNIQRRECETWYMDGDAWTLVQQQDQPDRNVYFETVLTQANGLLGIRGHDEEASQGRPSVREGYLGGIFAELDEEATRVNAGNFPWPDSQMVGLPDLFGCRISLHGEAFSLGTGQVLEFRRELSLRDAVLTRCVTWRSPAGRTSRLCFRRFLSAATPSLGFQQVEVEALNWSGEAVLDFGFETNIPTVFRCGDTRQPLLPQYHYRLQSSGAEGPCAWIETRTNGTGHVVVFASTVSGGRPASAVQGQRVEQIARTTMRQGESCTVERAFAVVSDRDAADPKQEALGTLARVAGSGFDGELRRHRAVWASRWEVADIEIEGEPRDQKVVRFGVFQLLQLMPPPGKSLSIPARGLSFNRYQGLYFWDTETFVLPFYTFVLPDRAADLLKFRYDTLGGARETARAILHRRGALFPWMADSQPGLDHALEGRSVYLQHQNADIAYAIDQYARAIGDLAFMAMYGLPILVETARFWADHLVQKDGTWHSVNAAGPDEDRGPGQDNGYTNLLARHNLQLAIHWADKLKQEAPEAFTAAAGSLKLEESELQTWQDAANGLVQPVVPDTAIPLQDQYLLSKEAADMEGWHLREQEKHWRLPPGKTVDDFQLIKQADIILGMFLLQDRFPAKDIAAAYDFYEPMTQHISSLSYNTHAIVAARLGRAEQAYDYFHRSAALDLDDIKQVTRDGLHAAALGGCWQAVVFGFAGMDPLADAPRFHPHLPAAWKSLTFTVVFRGKRHRIRLTPDGRQQPR